MPVSFHPDNRIDALEKIIVKRDGSPLYGEIDFYRKLHKDLSASSIEWEVWHDLKLPNHSDTNNYYKKTSAQIDFVVLSKFGIIIIEVKGGPISIRDNKFYYGKNFESPMKQNPFKQAEGYKFTLKDIVLNNFKKCFFCEVVSFPHVDYPFQSRLIDSHLLWTSYLSPQYNHSIESFLITAIEYAKNKHKKHFRSYNNLTVSECSRIKKILSPKIGDRNQINTVNTLEWLGLQNVEILEGLYKNPRILIEGPPGSGKTTLAKAFIDKQENKKGIYLCWNNLLMHYTKSVFKERNILNYVEVTTYFQFFKKLNPSISYEKMIQFDENEFYDLVQQTIRRLENDKKLVPYDFVVIDEAQDLFDRGLDLFINSFSGNNKNGLLNGNSLVLYDIDQSYSNSGRSVAEIADLISEYYAHFKLNEVKRSAQNPKIRALSIEVLVNPEVITKPGFNLTYDNINTTYHDDLKSVKKYLVKKVLTPIRETHSSLNGKDCIILIESTFLKGSYNHDEDLQELLIIKDVEELNKKNISDTSNKLRYTSILKYKGLEKKNVFLVISKPTEINKYEIFVGITRAILNLEINIVKS